MLRLTRICRCLARAALPALLGLWLCVILGLLAMWLHGYHRGLSLERKHEYSLATRAGGDFQQFACAGGRFQFWSSWQEDRYAGTWAMFRLLQHSSDRTSLRYVYRKPDPLTFTFTPGTPEPLHRQLGFGWLRQVNGPYGWNGWGITAPAWAVLGVVVAPWLLLLRLHRSHRTICQRRQFGLCLKCGYDLRSSGERCPECGTPTDRSPHVKGKAL